MELRVRSKTVASETVSVLRNAIAEGVLKPGQRLIEMELCERLGVSRPSLREALRTLESERLIVIVPNRGPSVAELTPDEARQIYEARILLEGEAAALAARNAAEADLKQMEMALSGFEAAVSANNLKELVEQTGEFYETLLRSSGNAIIHEIVRGLNARINVLRRRSMSQQGRSRESYKEMLAIYTAISQRNEEAARLASTQHVQNAAQVALRDSQANGNVN